MDPDLQHPAMAVHPPTLYLGYAAAAIPFACAFAAVLARKLDDEGILAARRWAAVSWFFITIGIILAPRISATATASAIIAGQILAGKHAAFAQGFVDAEAARDPGEVPAQDLRLGSSCCGSGGLGSSRVSAPSVRSETRSISRA